MNSRNKNKFAHLPTYDIKSFTWDFENGVGYLSDFSTPLHGRIWPDAADIGFTVLNHKTGREVAFVFKNNVTVDGDLVAQIFESISIMDIPSKTLTITLIND